MHSDLASSAQVPFFCGKEDEGTHRIAFLGRVDDQSLVSNDPRNLEAIFEGAATGSDIQAGNRSILQDRFQSAEISLSNITAQSENGPAFCAQTFYVQGMRWPKNGDQQEDRNHLEFRVRLEEHRARQALGAVFACSHRKTSTRGLR
jgi:hypothetical protein